MREQMSWDIADVACDRIMEGATVEDVIKYAGRHMDEDGFRLFVQLIAAVQFAKQQLDKAKTKREQRIIQSWLDGVKSDIRDELKYRVCDRRSWCC